MSGVASATAGGFRPVAVGGLCAVAAGVALIRVRTILGARNDVTGRHD
jgi:hypothetical protein